MNFLSKIEKKYIVFCSRDEINLTLRFNHIHKLSCSNMPN